MKTVKINLAGRERYLALTVEAMFQLQETFGGTRELMEAIQDNGREGFAATCRAAAILSEQGELARRAMGYDPESVTDPETIAAVMTPVEIAAMKMAVTSAVSLGFGREIEAEEGEVDLGLAELNEQKKRSDPDTLYPHWGSLRPV